MGDSAGLGLMAAFAVSGTVILVARHVHNRLLSGFMEQIDSEILRSKKYQAKKRVRFAQDVIEPSSNNEEYRKKCMVKSMQGHNNNNHHHRGDKVEMLENMPVNRQVMYKAIVEARCLKGYYNV